MASTFSSLRPPIIPSLLQSLSSLSPSSPLIHPTPIQSQLIPLALSSKRDILARARTGSGKTVAYVVPILQGIIEAKTRAAGAPANRDGPKTRALVLVPTRELAQQVTKVIETLSEGMGLQGNHENDMEGATGAADGVGVLNVAGHEKGKGKKKVAKGRKGGERMQRIQLEDRPDIIVATPSRALANLQSQSLDLSSLEYLVIDEADLILSYGHSSDDIKAILSGSWRLPNVYQSFLMSATLTAEVEELKGIILRDPAVIRIEDDQDELANLTQYCVRCSEEEKFLLLYVILKLKLIKGKCLIFVNNTDRGYRVKLFLEKFGIKSGVLNAELPFNSRYHAVQEFNRGAFDYLIATDESGLQGSEEDSEDEGDEEKMDVDNKPGLIPTHAPAPSDSDDEADQSESDGSPEPTNPRKRKRENGGVSKAPKKVKTANKAGDYGVSRGIDFIDVACVINFDLPFSARAYTHRVGRTARAGRTGTALSFVVPRKLWGKKRVGDICLPSAKRDEIVWKRIEKAQNEKAEKAGGAGGKGVKDYAFDMKQVEGFKYRMEDALKGVTRAAVRDARIKEIKNEVVNSEKLKAHFEEHPQDLNFLQHDKSVLHASRIQPHMKHVPSYLMPRIAAVGPSANPLSQPQDGSASTRKGGGRPRLGKDQGRGGGRGGRGRGRGQGRGKVDPLKKLKRK